MSRIVPASWMPSCDMDYIVTHWTAGSHHASELDKEHYHIIIEGDGRLVRGDHPITDNANTADGDYAAHCRLCNTRAIGVSVAAMRGATETPLHYGDSPVTREQWDALVQVCADLAERYGIPVTNKTILGHCEVQRNLGRKQNGKWDPWRVEWFPNKDRYQIGDSFRNDVVATLNGRLKTPAQSPVHVQFGSATIADDAFVDDGEAWVPVRVVTEAVGGKVESYAKGIFTVSKNKRNYTIGGVIRGNTGYAPVKKLREFLGFQTAWEGKTRTLILS